jgi:hypothetical protein
MGRKLAGRDNVGLIKMKMMSRLDGTANEAIMQVS